MSDVVESGTGLSLGRIADLTGGRLEGAADQVVYGVAPLETAEPTEVALFSNARYLGLVAGSRAGALLVSDALVGRITDDRPRVVVEDAHAALIPLLEALHPVPDIVPGVHATAVLGRGVRLGEDVLIGPYAVLEDGAVIGDRVRVGPHAVVGRGAVLGDDTVLHPHVVLYAGTVLGSRVTVHAGACIGVDGFGYAWSGDGHRKIPQIGRSVIEDDVEIGALSGIDRGSIGETRVGRGTKLDNFVHIGHNVRVGPHGAMAALTGIAGSTRIGAGVLIGGHVGVIGHLEIGDGARVAGAARVWRDVPPGVVVAGDPARPNREHLRARALVERLPSLVKRLEAVEARLASPEANPGQEGGPLPPAGTGPEAGEAPP